MKSRNSGYRFTPPPDRLQAFTLSEILITLVIIGVIAAITVPSLINNTNAHEYRSKLKKAVSGLNQALTLHYALEGLTIDDYSSESDYINFIFKKRMNIINIDGNTFNADYKINQNLVGCIPKVENSFITQDGTIFCFPHIYTEKGYPMLYIDVNGQRPPNKVCENSAFPSDQYIVFFSKDGVFPDEVANAVINESTKIKTGGFSEPDEEPEPAPPPWVFWQ